MFSVVLDLLTVLKFSWIYFPRFVIIKVDVTSHGTLLPRKESVGQCAAWSIKRIPVTKQTVNIH